mgnify:CR=1 FL=1
MALAFRHAHGIGVRESCPESALWYEQAARAAVDRRERAVAVGVDLGDLTFLARERARRDELDRARAPHALSPQAPASGCARSPLLLRPLAQIKAIAGTGPVIHQHTVPNAWLP